MLVKNRTRAIAAISGASFVSSSLPSGVHEAAVPVRGAVELAPISAEISERTSIAAALLPPLVPFAPFSLDATKCIRTRAGLGENYSKRW